VVGVGIEGNGERVFSPQPSRREERRHLCVVSSSNGFRGGAPAENDFSAFSA